MLDTQKKLRGRPKGATSTITITLGELLSKVGTNHATELQVGRTWFAKFNAVDVDTNKEIDDLPENIKQQLENSTEENTKIEFVVS